MITNLPRHTPPGPSSRPKLVAPAFRNPGGSQRILSISKRRTAVWRRPGLQLFWQIGFGPPRTAPGAFMVQSGFLAAHSRSIPRGSGSCCAPNPDPRSSHRGLAVWAPIGGDGSSCRQLHLTQQRKQGGSCRIRLCQSRFVFAFLLERGEEGGGGGKMDGVARGENRPDRYARPCPVSSSYDLALGCLDRIAMGGASQEPLCPVLGLVHGCGAKTKNQKKRRG